MSLTATFATPRRVPSRTAAEMVAKSASIEDVLTSIAKLAMPIVETLLKAPPAEAGKDKGKEKDKDKSGGDGLAGVLATLLQAIVGGGTARNAEQSVAKSISLGSVAQLVELAPCAQECLLGKVFASPQVAAGIVGHGTDE